MSVFSTLTWELPSAGGTGNAPTLSFATTPSLERGLSFKFKASNTNSAQVALTLTTTGGSERYPITANGGALQGGEIRAGEVVEVTYDGIHVAARTTNFIVSNNFVGQDQDSTSVSQRYGIYVEAGPSDYYVIMGNICYGNVTGPYDDLGTGTHKSVTGNVG